MSVKGGTLFYFLIALVSVDLTKAVCEGNGFTRIIKINAKEGNDSTICLNGSVPCKSLEFISNKSNNSCLLFSVGIHMIDGVVTFYNSSNVTLMGSGDPRETTLKCHDYSNSDKSNNLEFINPFNVTITNITFIGCGMISSALFAKNANLFYINNCIFSNNTGCAIQLENSLNTSIMNSLFFNNSGQVYDTSLINDNYGFDINQSSGGIGIVYRSVMNTSLTIKNCTFDSNHALKSPANINDSRPSDYQPFGTGGGVFIRFANVSYAKLNILDCKFVNNTALVRGGGLYVAFWGYSKSNSINIINSLFKENYCNDSGGAISLSSFSSSHGNSVTIADTKFTQNEANDSCGGLVYRFSTELISVETNHSVSNKILFKRCIFNGNRASQVPAAGLFMLGRVDRRTLPVEIEDTTFDNNMAYYAKCESKGRDFSRIGNKNVTSAVFAEIPIELRGNTIFSNNTGGGITIVVGRINIHGNITFENNCSPYDGGGINLQDESFIQLFSGSHIMFQNNSAKVGGAISVFAPILYKDTDLALSFNALCFIQYEVLISDKLAAKEWNLNVTFKENQAFIGGGALFVNDVSPCGYTQHNQTDSDRASSFNDSLLVLPRFTYRNNSVLRPPNTTNDPNFSSVSSSLNVSIAVLHNAVAPCEIFDCSVQGFDQNGNVQRTVFQMNAGDQACSIQDERIFYVEGIGIAAATVFGENLTGHCEGFSSNRLTKIKHYINYNILNPFTGDPFPEQYIEINITCCHTGYFFNETEKKCVFNHSRTIFVAANDNNRYVFIQTGYFAQHMRENNQFVYAILPTSYHKCTIQSESTTIQGCLFKFDYPYEQCSDNRTEFMCGKCPSNKGLSLNLSGCQHCQAWDITVFILFCLFIVVASILIMTFDIGLSNRLRGFLFFAQVVNIVYQRDSGEGTGLDYHLARQFGRSLYLPICLSSEMDALSVVLLGLIVPLMMFLMVLLFIFLSRHIRYLGHHQSVNGIWLIIFLLYVYTARSCFDLLRCVPAYDVNDNILEYRYYYDGSIQCYSGKHVYYAVVSYLLICIVILPGPFVVALISYRHFNRTAPFKDVATKGIKQKYWWWSSYELLRRLAFMIIIVFQGHFNDYQQLVLTLISIACLIITTRLHPYQSYWNNLIETLLLADLMLITAYYLTDSARFVATEDTFGIILLVIPFVYFIFYIATIIIKRLWFKFGVNKILKSDEDSETIAFTVDASNGNDQKLANREDNDSCYYEYRDELLVMDSIIQ